MKPESVPGQVLELVLDGVIVLVLYKTIIEEYHDVLLRPKFGFPEQIVKDILNEKLRLVNYFFDCFCFFDFLIFYLIIRLKLNIFLMTLNLMYQNNK